MDILSLPLMFCFSQYFKLYLAVSKTAKTAQYSLKYCLNGPINPRNKPTKITQIYISVLISSPIIYRVCSSCTQINIAVIRTGVVGWCGGTG